MSVLLVGGATHMRTVQNEVRSLFGPSQVMLTPDPQQVVARGACYYCAIRDGVRFPVASLKQIHDIRVRDILTRSYGVLGRNPAGQFGLSVVLPRNTLCDGTEFMYDRVALRSDHTQVVPIEFAAVPDWYAVHTFVPLPEGDPNRVVQPVELRIPSGVSAVSGQRLRLFLRPEDNGVIRGRAELMDRKDATKAVSQVEFIWTAGG